MGNLSGRKSFSSATRQESHVWSLRHVSHRQFQQLQTALPESVEPEHPEAAWKRLAGDGKLCWQQHHSLAERGATEPSRIYGNGPVHNSGTVRPGKLHGVLHHCQYEPVAGFLFCQFSAWGGARYGGGDGKRVEGGGAEVVFFLSRTAES